MVNGMKLRVFEAFAGYGSQSLALERLKRNFKNFDYEVVGISEIDKYAIAAYNALHSRVTNYGDISKINWDDVNNFDLFTYSSPCQDFSNSGKQAGGEEGSGTRSSFLWECRKAIIAKRPKYLLLENVKALVSNKFLPLFLKWQAELEEYGYVNYVQVLNAKNYGVPQNRERVFMLSIRNDGDNPFYSFPLPFELDRILRDVFEKSVDGKYYLSDTIIHGFDEHKAIANVATMKEEQRTVASGRKDRLVVEPKVIQVGNIMDDANRGFKNPQPGRIYSDEGLSPCLNTCQGGDRVPKVIEPKIIKEDNLVAEPRFRIRKLTPRECFRLMGVDDDDIDKIQASGISNSQQYKLSGNSIVVDVLYHIFRKAFTETHNEQQQLTLF